MTFRFSMPLEELLGRLRDGSFRDHMKEMKEAQKRAQEKMNNQNAHADRKAGWKERQKSDKTPIFDLEQGRDGVWVVK